MAERRKRLAGSCAGMPAFTLRRGRERRQRPIRATIVLRTDPLPESHPAARKQRARAESEPGRRPKLSRRELAEILCPRDEDIRRVVSFAHAYGLRVRSVSRLRHDVEVEGSVADMERAFGVELNEYDDGRGPQCAYEADLELPDRIHDVVEDVIGLDETTRYRAFAHPPGAHVGALSPLDVAEHYDFPRDLSGEGQRIAILSFGGGYYRQDMAEYFQDVLGIAAPRVREVRVQPRSGSRPLPRARLAEIAEAGRQPDADLNEIYQRFGGDFSRAIEDLEATQDIQICGGVANGSTIDVYFSRGDDLGLYQALYAALGIGAPRFRRRRLPAAISISWGLSECARTMKSGAMRPVHRALELASLLDVPVICATGDYGSYGSQAKVCGGEMASVSFPASSPHAVACGGTQFAAAADGGRRETAWNSPNLGVQQATGGGVSGFWDRPGFQHRVDVPSAASLGDGAWLEPTMDQERRSDFRGRGVPDVAAYADPQGGYQVLLAGVRVAGSGTSAAAPLWAGLCARFCERLGDRMPWLNDVIYRPEVAATFRPVVGGDNDLSGGQAASFDATPGWDACSGLGAPDGTAMLAALESLCDRAR